MVVVLIILVLLIAFAVVSFNSLVGRRNRVENAWAQIDVQLKRRLDLIPNLVETVKGYAAHEATTLDAVVKARNAAISAPATPAGQSAPSDAISGALRQLFALSESYPDLKANANFLSLQEELTATEGRVGYARQFYNDEVLGFNAAIQKFPGVLLAGIMHLTPREYFKAEPEAQNPPKVQF